MKRKGYELDTDLSDRETTVFYNPTSKKVIVGYRGTALGDFKTVGKDLRSDISIFLGKTRNDERFREATQKYDTIRSKYDGYKIDLTGHSLGGALAKHVNDRRQDVDQAVTFSRGSTPFHLQKNKDNQLDRTNAFDPVLWGALMENGKKSVNYTPIPPPGSHNLALL
jgi:hypothetical protein